jgi:transposase
MATRAKQYTQAFVTRAVALCEAANRPITEVARDLGVGYATLYGWMRKAGKTRRGIRGGAIDTPSAAAPSTPQAMQAEIERLQRELEETKKQLEFAKKAAAFFAQQNK